VRAGFGVARGKMYFSELRGKQVFDAAGEKLGALDDLIVLDGPTHAEVIALTYASEGRKKKVSWQFVAAINKGVQLKVKRENLSFLNINDSDISLKDNILDKQLIDINGLKVVRVNDIILSKAEDKFVVTSVDVGMKGFVRRLGLGVEAKGSNIIPWEYVEPLQSDSKDLRLKVSRHKLSTLHPADIADIMEELSHHDRAVVFTSLDDKTAAETLLELKPEVRSSVFRGIKSKRVATILEKIPADEAADLLSVLSEGKANELLNLMNPETVKNIMELLEYPEESAGRVMSTDFIAITENFSVQETIEKLREIAPSTENIFYLYVVDQAGHLVGVLSLRQLIISQPNIQVSEIMEKDVIKINTEATKEEAAKIIFKYNLLALPVTNPNNELEGIITVDDVLGAYAPKEWKKKKLKLPINRYLPSLPLKK